jgi:hypothetical protein
VSTETAIGSYFPLVAPYLYLPAKDHLAEEQDGYPRQPQIQSPQSPGNLLPGNPQAWSL